MALLEVDAIHTAYGLSKVLFGVSLVVEKAEVVALLGRNGVGKTTTLRSIIGLTPASQGTVCWDGHDITNLPAHAIVRRGIGFVPEDRRIFPELTVWENLDIGHRPPHGGQGEGWTIERVYELFPNLAELRDRLGGYLSGGEQQMLTIARSLMGNPRLLLLDEPSEGLAPLVVEALKKQIDQLRAAGLSIILAEQSLDFVLSLSSRVYILEKGEVKFTADAAELRGNDALLRQYLTV